MTRRRGSGDVSLGFLATITGGYLMWLLYGISITNIPSSRSTARGLSAARRRSQLRYVYETTA